MSRPYALATNLLQPMSLQVLEDWIEFLGRPPATLHCFCGGNPAAKTAIETFCNTHNIALELTPDEVCEDVRASELEVVKWQFSHATEEWCFLVRLDALPFRVGEEDWLDRCIEMIEAKGFMFATGAARVFRADTSIDHPHYMATQRLSNNCILLRPRDWLALEEQHTHLRQTFGRYYTEGFFETYLRESDNWGLRLVNRPDWRVFHVQVWDERMFDVRENFRSGQGVGPFLEGYEDDYTDPWTRWYMFPKTPLSKRLRVKLGRLKRQVFSR